MYSLFNDFPREGPESMATAQDVFTMMHRTDRKKIDKLI